MAERLARSALYVPGDSPEKLAKAFGRGADELIVDLEDAVAADRKDYARAIIIDWLADDAGADGSVAIWIRINCGDEGLADVRSLAGIARIAGFVAAKTEAADEIGRIDSVLTQLGSSARLVPLLESAAAVMDARAIAGAPRVHRIQVGEADLRADVGITPGPGEHELLYSRSHVVFASSAAGIAPPIAPVSTEFRDLAAYRDSTESLARMGFVGRACIHPAQVAVANEVFTPSSESVEWARDVLNRLVSATSGVALDTHGRMIDEAVGRQARRILALLGESDDA